MLKGHVFSRQLFENQIYAACNNTFLNGWNGILDYKNKMAITYSGSNVTVDSGLAVIQGRPVEEDTSTTISAGTENMYCKLVIEIDLDKVNTESDFEQAYYKILTNASSYPNLTQTNIVKNNAGIYQYELARFRTSANGISDFQDKRTFLDFDTIYDEIRQHIEDIDTSTFLGDLISYKGFLPDNTDLNDLTATGIYNTGSSTLINAGTNYQWSYLFVINFGYMTHQYLIKPASNIIMTRERSGSPLLWRDWKKLATADETVAKGDFAVLTGTLTISASSSNTATLSYPSGFNKNNSVLISNGLVLNNDSNAKGYNYYGIYSDSTDGLNNAFRRRINFINDGIKLYVQNPNSEELTLQYKLVIMKVS